MSRRQYPRLDSIRNKPPGKPCACCDVPAVAVVWVQWIYMRGEDEDYPACDLHRRMARDKSTFGNFIAAIRPSVESTPATSAQTDGGASAMGRSTEKGSA